MKKLILLCVLLSGCATMTPREKQTVWIVAGVVAGAVIIASSSNNAAAEQCTRSIIIGPNGSNEVCR